MATRKEIRVNPMTRVNGAMEIEVIVENKVVIDAKAKSLNYRGMELMMRGRSPLDAIYFTQRLCGICSTAHSTASVTALEDAMGIEPNNNDKMIRDFMHSAEFLQNHLRHIYQHVVPDYVNSEKIYNVYPIKNKYNRIPDDVCTRIAHNYYESIMFSRGAHEIIAELGGKVPHNQGMIPGGVNTEITMTKYLRIKAALKSIKKFIYNEMLQDLQDIAKYFPEYYKNGKGPENFMSFGYMHQYQDDLSYLKPYVTIRGKEEPLDINKITEEVSHSWINTDKEVMEADYRVSESYDIAKPSAYSWCRAPRYKGETMEVGPLARCLRTGAYSLGISTMDRNLARVYELMEISKIMEELLEGIEVKETQKWSYNIPKYAKGKGLIDTTRGALGHWIEIREGKVYNYSIITPSAWYLSPMDKKGVKGALENALIGCEIEDVNNPMEIGRIVRSYDPCISCACHVSGDIKPITIRVV